MKAAPNGGDQVVGAGEGPARLAGAPQHGPQGFHRVEAGCAGRHSRAGPLLLECSHCRQQPLFRAQLAVEEGVWGVGRGEGVRCRTWQVAGRAPTGARSLRRHRGGPGWSRRIRTWARAEASHLCSWTLPGCSALNAAEQRTPRRVIGCTWSRRGFTPWVNAPTSVNGTPG